jgi:hypothetical protein
MRHDCTIATTRAISGRTVRGPVFPTDLRADVTPTRLQAGGAVPPPCPGGWARADLNRWARKANSGGMTYLWESEGARGRPRLKGLLSANPPC